VRSLAVLLVASALLPGAPALAQEVRAARAGELLRMVRHDCGACHGMRLTGGLGPALTRAALADKPPAVLAATILHGRPGTAMPAWRGLLSDGDAIWIAERLASGLADEQGVRP
jgi:cytochrome c55X